MISQSPWQKVLHLVRVMISLMMDDLAIGMSILDVNGGWIGRLLFCWAVFCLSLY